MQIKARKNFVSNNLCFIQLCSKSLFGESTFRVGELITSQTFALIALFFAPAEIPLYFIILWYSVGEQSTCRYTTFTQITEVNFKL